jgi:hypothetical protein
MFPNARLMIATIFVSVVVLVCGFVSFAAFRVTHAPLSRSAFSGALQLTADGIEAVPAARSPFETRFSAEPAAAVRSPLSLSVLQLGGRDAAVSWPDAATALPAPPDPPEPEAIAAVAPPPAIADRPAAAEIAPLDMAAVSATPLAPEAVAGASPEPAAPLPPAAVALSPGSSSPAQDAAALPLAPPLPLHPAMTAEPADAPAPMQVAHIDTPADPIAEPAAEVPAVAAPAEISATDLGTDPPALTGKLPLPKAAPKIRTARPAPTAAAGAAAKTAKPAAKAHAARKPRARTVASGNRFSALPQPDFKTGGLPSSTPMVWTQNPQRRSTGSAPVGGPFVGPNSWSR